MACVIPEDPKLAMRAAIRARRDGFVGNLDPQSAALAFRTPPSPLRALIDRARCVAGYAPLGSEADPAALVAYAHEVGCDTALPFVVSRSVPIRFLRWAPGEPLFPGPFGLDQPDRATSIEVEPDLIMAPLLGFDRRLHRLGQGAAHYDRVFARFPDAIRVGIAWSVQEEPFVPDDPWDVPLDAILTEREWIARDRGTE